MKQLLYIAACSLVLASYSCLAATGPALVARWQFDEASGTNVTDSAGVRHGYLSPNGAAFVAGGVSGNALSLVRANNGFALMPYVRQLTNNFSLSSWVRMNAGDTEGPSVIVTQDNTWHVNGLMLYVNEAWSGASAANKATFLVNDPSQSCRSTTTINDGEWHHVLITRSTNGQSLIYVDGAPAEGGMASSPMVDLKAPFMVGGLYGYVTANVPGGYFTGLIDEVQIYDDALSDAQIDLLYQHPGWSLEQATSRIRFEPSGGDFVGSVQVTLTTDIASSTIRYTLDGAEPDATSAAYAGPITLSDTTTIRARLFVAEFPASEIMETVFTKVPPITFLPSGGLFTNSVEVELSLHLGVGSIAYTVDGSTPLASSMRYGGPFTLTNGCVVKARVFLDSFGISDVMESTFARVYALDDGVSNAWREKYFGAGYLTDPRVGANEDPDRDGWSNLLEMRENTDPTDPASHPLILMGIKAIPKVTWSSIVGLKYQVLRKTNVAELTWEVVLPPAVASVPSSTFIDPDAPATSIYRIELVP